MRRPPTPEDWQRLVELTEGGHVPDDYAEFVLGVIQRYNPALNDRLEAFVRWKVDLEKKSRQKKAAVHKLADIDRTRIFSVRTALDDLDAAIDAESVRERVGQAAYAVLKCRYGEGLSVTATAKRLGMSRESVGWIEEEALKIVRASPVVGYDSGYGDQLI